MRIPTDMARWHSKRTLPIIAKYKRPTCPVRPGTLPYKDGELIDAILDAKSHNGANRKARKVLKIFGEWRSGVLASEGKAVSNIVLLLEVHRHFVKAGYEDEAEEVRRFLASEYDMRPTDGSVADIRELATIKARRFDVLSDAVLNERAKPLFEPQPREDDDLGNYGFGFGDDDE